MVRRPSQTCPGLRFLMDLNSSDESDTEVAVVVTTRPGPTSSSPPPSTALVVAPAWQRLTSYLEAHGGSAALVSGWRTRSGTRASGGGKRGSGKPHDVYYYDEHNTKFRSCKEVAQHFGLIDRRPGFIQCPALSGSAWPFTGGSWRRAHSADLRHEPERHRARLGRPREPCTRPAI